MPTYEYRCGQCGAKFKRFESIAKHGKGNPRCPKCDSKKTARVPGRTYVVTSKKS
ncbi:MAG: FmdB family zinc ribbon protein [Alphaproteobacteria bacterium]